MTTDNQIGLGGLIVLVVLAATLWGRDAGPASQSDCCEQVAVYQRLYEEAVLRNKALEMENGVLRESLHWCGINERRCRSGLARLERGPVKYMPIVPQGR